MIIFSPWIDIILLAVLIYLIEYGIYKFFNINIFKLKYVLIATFIDVLFLLLVGYGLGYSNLDLIFPFGLNWFWYSFIIMIIVELSVIKLYNIKFYKGN